MSTATISKKGDLNFTNDNIRVKKIRDMLSPVSIIERFPLSKEGVDRVAKTRIEVANILHGKDDRLLVIIGPCSIHDVKAAEEYAKRLKTEIEKYRDTLCIVMRVYFEKPRTTVGWKGLINDPYLNNTYQINDGIALGRKILVDINELGVPTAGEFLDTMSPQYIADLMSWGAIGARTTESQLHRELASGLSCPIGFKNATTGSVQVAVDAMVSASYPHTFLGITKFGQVAIIETTGNHDVHVILRGGSNGTNYDAESVQKVVNELEKTPFTPAVMVDCSHANSSKDYRRQSIVCADIANQIKNGSYHINGVMIESHLKEGRQDLTEDNINSLEYGKSITDGCVSWETTEELLATLAAAVQERRTKFPRTND
ncbi:3-deoxy-7-phosphoheptulonate synthase [Psittacicella hinzii]|uniref:Phospho-2-dehydro-3-deoxyheptonate aldolase n=1 Tax=Psittacicella hinzii TaxID=2028575 RepID=A0A3A1YG50_9GAMM|nr:3-deoxy-7-phosphoheptulonate synthase [Psittacicella hinzii]RIY35194.1 3-deoxy-7-phosphoheptulonate synthase [Psittacicella hinzii]